MKFGPVPVEDAVGMIIGHNIAGPDGKRIYRKGAVITAGDVGILKKLGKSRVYAAELEPGDIREDQAALRVAHSVIGPGLRLSGPAAGRVNLLSTIRGVMRINLRALVQINRSPGTTLAALPAHQVVHPRQVVATVKVIPYAVPQVVLDQLEDAIAELRPVVSIDELTPRKVAIIISGSESVQERLVSDFEPPLRTRVESYGSQATQVAFLRLEEVDAETALSRLLQVVVSEHYDLIILAGETAIMDRCDLAPRAVEQAGGDVECVGVPVDPGNLLMLAYIGNVPVIGAPGCARSLKTNALDWILPRLLTGERLHADDLAQMGHGGLLEDTSERPMPRNLLV